MYHHLMSCIITLSNIFMLFPAKRQISPYHCHPMSSHFLWLIQDLVAHGGFELAKDINYLNGISSMNPHLYWLKRSESVYWGCLLRSLAVTRVARLEWSLDRSLEWLQVTVSLKINFRASCVLNGKNGTQESHIVNMSQSWFSSISTDQFRGYPLVI